MYKFIMILLILINLFLGLHGRIEPIALFVAGFLAGELFMIWLNE